MAEHQKTIGRCLCGKIELHAANKPSMVGACHCNMCRKWGGGPFMEVNCGVEVSFSGEDYVKVFDSSEWAERGFCSNCGTTCSTDSNRPGNIWYQ